MLRRYFIGDSKIEQKRKRRWKNNGALLKLLLKSIYRGKSAAATAERRFPRVGRENFKAREWKIKSAIGGKVCKVTREEAVQVTQCGNKTRKREIFNVSRAHRLKLNRNSCILHFAILEAL